MRERKVLLITALLAAAAVLLSPQSAHCIHTGKAERPSPEFSRTRLIVKLKPQADKRVVLGKIQGKVTTGLAQLDSLNLRFQVAAQKRLFEEFRKTASRMERFSSVYVLEVPPGTDLKRMLREYIGRPEVEYAELDYRLELFEKPSDPLFSHQWYLNNTGQGYLGIERRAGDGNDRQIIKYGSEDADIDALEVFERNDETTIPLVGIIDTGIDLDHPDLKENVWVNPGEDINGNGVIDPGEINGVDDDHNGFVDDFYGWDFSGHYDENNQIVEDNDPTDYYGHGTHCAGIVAAVRDNAVGVSGIVTPCRIMSIKLFPYAFHSLGAKSIIYAADMGCDVINMSWGGPYASKLIQDALDYATSKGVLPVAAAGNSGAEDNFYPASFPQVLTVGASNSVDQVTYFSTYGEHIEVVAPGEDILSLRADSTDMYSEGGASGSEPNVHIVDSFYYLADGTSMASPCVVGVAAYLMAASPGLSIQRVSEIIEESADDMVYPYGPGSPYSPGPDIYSGSGRVNLNSAVQLLSGRLAKIDYPYENAIVSGDVAIIGTAGGESFQDYLLECGEGFSPEEWVPITNSDLAVSKDTLGVWNSSGLTGLYTIRLTVGDQNQAVVHVRVDNDVYVKITSPAEGDTVVRNAEIWGYTIAPGFSHYIMEYGYGKSPSFWIPIDTSTKMVAGDLLGSWMVSFLEETDYALRLTVKTRTGDTYADTAVVYVKSIASGGWFAELTSLGSLSPAVGDIDGDGHAEIVVGVGAPEGWEGTGGVEVFSHQGQREVGWPRDTDKNMMSSPALGDLDGDGIDDIVICCDPDGVYAYLSNSPDWIRRAGVGGYYLWSLATPVIADLENDGSPEVLTMNDRGMVYAWRNDGEPVIWGGGGVFAQTQSGTGLGLPCVAVADLDGDGESEIIAAAADGGYNMMSPQGGIYVWNTAGHLVLGPGDYPDVFTAIYGMAVANIDSTEDLEIVALGSDTSHFNLCAFKKDGTQVENYPLELEGLSPRWWFANQPAVGDLEGDGILEIVISMWVPGEGRIYAWHQDGTPLGALSPSGLLVCHKSPDSQRKMKVLSTLGDNIAEVTARIRRMSKEELSALLSLSDDPVFSSVAETFGCPVLADVNADGEAEIIARAGYYSGTGYERVFAWDYEGNLVPGFPLFASAVPSAWSFYPYIPLVEDLDGDGKVNIAIVSDWPDYKLICWELDADYHMEAVHWPKHLHDKWNSAKYEFQPPAGEEVNVPPLSFRAKSWDDSSVTLAWTPKAPWTSLGYNIYRSTVAGEPGEKRNGELIVPADSQYQDIGVVSGETYYYTITNVNTHHDESVPSREVEITIGQPSAPDGLKAQLDGGTVILSWKPNPPEEDVSGYILYHKAPNYSDYLAADSVTAETSYTDSSLKWSGAHFYRVVAVHSSGTKSYPSEAIQVGLQLTAYRPGALKISSWYGTDVTLSWRVGQTGGGCNVYRSTLPGVYQDHPLNPVLIEASVGTAITYQDTGLLEGVIYHYVVTQVCEEVEIPSATEVEFLAGRPQTVSGFAAEVRDCHIVVRWTANAEADVTNYRVYDKVPPKDFFVLVNSVESDTIYVDPAVDDSLAHNFLVTAVDSLGLESLFPNGLPAAVNGPLYPLGPPGEFKILDHSDTSITFKVFSSGAEAYNIYRSQVSGTYTQPPVNAEPIPSYYPWEYTCYVPDLTEGQSNFFNATCIWENECGVAESRMDAATEVCFIPGLPMMVTGLVAELDTNCHAVLCWNPSPEGDVLWYRIYRRPAGTGGFTLKDSVLVPENLYVDITLVDTVKHYYVVTAVDSLGLEGPFSPPVEVWPHGPYEVYNTQVIDWTNTSVSLRLEVRPHKDIIGLNVYRTWVSGYYDGLDPINDTLLSVDSASCAYYTDLNVKEGRTYFYTGTSVNKCGLESEFYHFEGGEDTVLVGKPHPPALEAESRKDDIRLHMSSSETDVKGYKIFRSEGQGGSMVMEPLHPDTVYADTSAAAGIQYYYQAAVVDTMELEGEASGKAEGCIMTLDKGMIVVNMTHGRDIFDGVRGDSVEAFYRRALEVYDYAYIPYDSSVQLSLFDLSSHPLAVVHSEDEPSGSGISSYYALFKRYLQAGGALLIEGRRNLWRPPVPAAEGLFDVSAGAVAYDYLNIDSAHLPPSLQSGAKPEFIGADRAPQVQGYPETIEVDTFRVNHAYDPYWFDLQGKLPGVGHFVPLDYSEVLYTFVSAYDTSAADGKPVALKHFTDDFAVIYFDFPLYFIQEETATQILHKAISDLQEFVNPHLPAPYAAGLDHASVFPNPFKPYQGHTHMIFDGLTHQAKIEVFTLTGEKVCSIQETDGDGQVWWDVTNSRGNKLASGIYIYRITNESGQEKISKFAVIR